MSQSLEGPRLVTRGPEPDLTPAQVLLGIAVMLLITTMATRLIDQRHRLRAVDDGFVECNAHHTHCRPNVKAWALSVQLKGDI